MNAKELFRTTFLLIILLSLLQGCRSEKNQKQSFYSGKKTGIADIDLIRSEIASIPTMKENAKSRHAALDRWWQLV